MQISNVNREKDYCLHTGQMKTNLVTLFAGFWKVYDMNGPVAQWIGHLTTNQGIPGSNPREDGRFSWVLSFTTIFHQLVGHY